MKKGGPVSKRHPTHVEVKILILLLYPQSHEPQVAILVYKQ